MPVWPHIERHFQASATVRDIVIGMSDGLTVPFALAGSIAMGVGGYLAARTDQDHYHSEVQREVRETYEMPEEEEEEVARVFREYGLPAEDVSRIVTAIASDPDRS